ncbi:putative peptidase, S54 (Rhomboid) family [Crocosphaera subtropica ATCC 51142]|uniref:Peptidase, S54 (Rhomboid) family n=1 Tax=Crocosphaera subtropica (strain ATCC 51142 / BH68) TaxID=43989 RepID=B1WVW9_CROS5|nr:rhomboid family intramembrane serine protease [Crocosphaera subtropica]ACB52302.1 putative peptidase, S54 (Rhomboid) family [Crocosphaera subtropica ATCC 51142]
MVPLNDNNPTQRTAYVTYGLIILNVLVFFKELSLSSEELSQFFQYYAIVPKQLTAGFSGVDFYHPIPEWMTLFTSQFLHAGFLHIAGNMLFLWIFGNNVEDKLGHVKYLIFYLTCGVLAGLSQWYFAPYSEVPSLGASGAIAGVMGAYILRFPQAQVLTLIPLGIFITTIRIPAVFFLGFWFLQQAIYGFASLNVQTNVGMEGGGVAYWAHAGGFVFGFILGPLLGLLDDKNR